MLTLLIRLIATRISAKMKVDCLLLAGSHVDSVDEVDCYKKDSTDPGHRNTNSLHVSTITNNSKIVSINRSKKRSFPNI